MAHSRSHSTFCVLKTHGQAKPLHSDQQSSVLVSEAQIRYRSSSSSIRAEIASLFPLFPHREGILVLSELDVTLASQMSLKHLVCALCCVHRAVGSWQRCVRTSLPQSMATVSQLLAPCVNLGGIDCHSWPPPNPPPPLSK